jgi:hypothetical protein
MVSEFRTASELVDAITGGPASPVMPAERTEPLTTTGPVHVAGTSLPVWEPEAPIRTAERRTTAA